MQHVALYPDMDSPEVFGLHPNADLTYKVNECTSLFQLFAGTLPRQVEVGDQGSFEDVVGSIAADLLKKLPAPYPEVCRRVFRVAFESACHFMCTWCRRK